MAPPSDYLLCIPDSRSLNIFHHFSELASQYISSNVCCKGLTLGIFPTHHYHPCTPPPATFPRTLLRECPQPCLLGQSAKTEPAIARRLPCCPSQTWRVLSSRGMGERQFLGRELEFPQASGDALTSFLYLC